MGLFFKVITRTSGSTCKPRWSQDHPDLQKNAYIHLAKKCIYTLGKKLLYIKLTYCDHSNKNVEYPNLRISKNWVQEK